jgi:putative polyketide hydroxylase
MTEQRPADVIIGGGGLVGLATALFLSWHGVPCVLLEQHQGISPHPRARGLSPRTMELFREVGAEETLRSTESARTLAHNAGIVAVQTLAGPEIGRLSQPYHMDSSADFTAYSPVTWCVCHQDVVEPKLRDEAARLGAQIRFGTRLASFRQDGDGVTVVAEDRATGRASQLRGRYLIAADGAASPVREELGIGTHGPGTLAHFLNIQFDCDLREVMGDRRFIICYTTGGGMRSALLPINNADRWLLHVPFDPAEEAEFTPERCAGLVRAATGLPGAEVTIRGAVPWESAGRVADRFSAGRVFLAGDSAHVMPPSGAYGSNTGIHDAHNLAWKIAAVLRGDAGQELLASYDHERRPAADLVVEQAVLRSRDRPRLVGTQPQAPPDPAIEIDATVMFGIRYRSQVISLEPGPGTGPWERVLSGRPGSRAPHVWLEADGAKVSTIDLFGRDFVLMTGVAGVPWAEAAARIAANGGPGLASYLVAPPGAQHARASAASFRVTRLARDIEDRWCAAYGLTSAGAVLVRPDGYVCWRSPDGCAGSADAHRQLNAAISRALGRPAAHT